MKKELASGHLQVKGGKYYVVLYLPQPNGKKKAKWISTHLDERGNKTRAEEMLRELRQNTQEESFYRREDRWRDKRGCSLCLRICCFLTTSFVG